MAQCTIIDNTNKAITSLKALRFASGRKENAINSPFLRMLPAEIRNLVYSEFVPTDGYITSSEIRDYTVLLRICSQIREEATPIFYSMAKFHIEINLVVEGTQSTGWIESISRKNAERLTNVVFCFKSSALEEKLKAFDPSTLPHDKFMLGPLLRPRVPSVDAVIYTVVSRGVPEHSVGSCCRFCHRCSLKSTIFPGSCAREEVDEDADHKFCFGYLSVYFRRALSAAPWNGEYELRGACRVSPRIRAQAEDAGFWS
jgi:hypothetical protein